MTRDDPRWPEVTGCCRRVLRDPDERGAARARGGGRGAAQGALRGASPPRQGRGDAARGAGEAHSRALSAVGAEQPRAPCELGGGAEAARPPLAHPLAAPPRRHRPGARGGQGVVPGRPRERRPLSRGGARPEHGLAAFGRITPLHPVAAGEGAWAAAAPAEATLFAWAFPLAGARGTGLVPQSDEERFVVSGGFVYFDGLSRVCGVRAASPGVGLAFDGPNSLLDELSHGARVREVLFERGLCNPASLPSLRDCGVDALVARAGPADRRRGRVRLAARRVRLPVRGAVCAPRLLRVPSSKLMRLGEMIITQDAGTKHSVKTCRRAGFARVVGGFFLPIFD